MPDAVRRTFGSALTIVQCGETPGGAKPVEIKAVSAMKICEDFDGETYRCAYTTRFGEAVYVLHVFQKKSTSGIATPKPDLSLIESRYKQAKEHHAARLREEQGRKRDQR